MTKQCHCCEDMCDHIDDPGGLIIYDERFGDYSVRIGRDLIQPILFCPWCGVKLPLSLRDEWFDELEKMGLDPRVDDIPEPYQSGAWRTRH